MKKIILSIAAMLTFSIASAQIDKDQPQQTQPDAVNGVEPDTKNKADQEIEVPIDPKTIEQQKEQNNPRKDELKTRDHVKSTPDPTIVKDKTKDDSKKTTDRNKKKKRRN